MIIRQDGIKEYIQTSEAAASASAGGSNSGKAIAGKTTPSRSANIANNAKAIGSASSKSSATSKATTSGSANNSYRTTASGSAASSNDNNVNVIMNSLATMVL